MFISLAYLKQSSMQLLGLNLLRLLPTISFCSQFTFCKVWDLQNLPNPVSGVKGNVGAVRSVCFSRYTHFLVVAEPASLVHVYETKINSEKMQQIDFFGEIS